MLEEPKKNNNIIIIIMLILSFMMIILFVVTNQYNKCSTEECFIEYANDCRNAVFENEIIGIEFSYSIDHSCTLTKKVKDVNIEGIEYLKNQEMECVFKKNSFDERLLNDFISGTSDCEGKLKDSLLDIYKNSNP